MLIKKLLHIVAISFLLGTFVFAASAASQEKLGAVLYGVDGDKEKEFMAVIAAMKAKGYKLSDPHERINDAYVTKYGNTTLDNLGFFSTTNDMAVKNILIKNPKMGGFSPFNFHVYKKKGENITWFGHLDPEAMADMAGLKDPKLRKEYVASFVELDKLAQDMLKPTHKKELKYKSLPKYTLMEFEMPFDPTDDAIDEFQEKFEAEFEGAKEFENTGYIIAGYKNFKEIYEGDKAFNYDAYWVYSLCHFKYSYNIFNAIPEAGIFAPCSIYMYVDKGTKVLKIGMPVLANWTVAGINDPVMLESMDRLDAEIIKVFETKLGAKLVGRK